MPPPNGPSDLPPDTSAGLHRKAAPPQPARATRKPQALPGREKRFENQISEVTHAKKYGIDYAIRKDTSEVPPRYLVFFKATDAEAFHSAFKEYSASLLNKDKRPSVLAKLHDLAQSVANLPDKVRHKQEERGL